MTCRHAARAGREAGSKNKQAGSVPAARSVRPARGARGVRTGGVCSFLQGRRGSRARAEPPEDGTASTRESQAKSDCRPSSPAWHCIWSELMASSHRGPAGCKALEAWRLLLAGAQAGAPVGGCVFHHTRCGFRHHPFSVCVRGVPAPRPPSAGWGCRLSRSPMEEGLSLPGQVAGTVCLPVAAGVGSPPWAGSGPRGRPGVLATWPPSRTPH